MRGFFIIRSVTRYRRYPGTQPLIIRVLRTQSSERPEGVFVAVLCTNRVVYYSTGNATILFNHINTISNIEGTSRVNGTHRAHDDKRCSVRRTMPCSREAGICIECSQAPYANAISHVQYLVGSARSPSSRAR